MIHYPKMIIFYYGHTLLYELDWNTERGNLELMKHIKSDSKCCTLEDIKKGIELVFGEHIENIRKMILLKFLILLVFLHGM